MMEDNINRKFPCTWYAIGFTKELTNRPLKKKIVGKDIVLFRDEEGKARAVYAYCPHRGADLSLGCVQQGKLACAYHGWEFDGEGNCLHIPSQPDKPIPKFAHTESYPVTERAGLIWVYPEAGQKLESTPQLELFEELENKDFVLAPYESFWKAHFTRVVESVLDVVHLSFVHKKTIGKNSNPVIQQLQIEGEDDSFYLKNGSAYLYYDFPQHWILRPESKKKAQFINYVTFTPVDEEETLILGYAGRTFAKKLPVMNRVFSKYSLKVLNEDQAVVESQHPRPIPEALQQEAHVYADGAQIKFRQRWFEFLQGNEPTAYLDKK